MNTDAAGPRCHSYATHLTWEGNLGRGTSGYSRYSRKYRVSVDGKPDLAGSADPAFRGEPDRHNPEDLFVSAISACHMLFYLALCARSGVRVVVYEDEASGILTVEPEGGGRFEEVVLRPAVTIADPDGIDLAARLHETAHERCFIANSCRVPVRVLPVVSVSGAAL
jgi:organic hydroperoxide reductase OsmC/OhrA